MDRHLPPHPGDRPPYGHHHAPPPSSLPPPYHVQTAQPPTQIPFSDPFPHNRDPFRPSGHEREPSVGLAGRGWPPAQGHGVATPAPNHPLPPPPPPHQHPNGLSQMPLPYDPSRRRSLGGAGSPPQYAAGPLEPPAQPPSFPTRNMPPPSPPQMHSNSSASSVLGPAPRGPPTASPFAGIRDLASLSSSHRPAGGMSISSILGGGEDGRRPGGSPHGSAAALPPGLHQGMQPPSPGRARSSSMREGYNRGVGELSPGRIGMLGEPRSASAALGHDRFGLDARRDGMFRSPQLPRESAHSFRAFRAPPEQSPNMNGNGAPARPSSQPVEPGPARSIDEIMRREDPMGGRLGVFRAFGDGPHKPRADLTPRHDMHPFQNGVGPTSQPNDRSIYGSPASKQDSRDQPGRYQPGAFGPPTREEHMGMFRPSYQPPAQAVLDQARESIETRPPPDMRRDMQRATPPLSDFAPMNRYRNGYHERPLTLEEHQRMEALNRDLPQRKESDGSHRSIFNISPDLERKGRNSPLPQAVQGAQPRHVGPGGDHPGIKSEFGRMFSGLGSGVGSATPVAGQSANGTTTPSRLSPSRQVDRGDLVRTAVSELEDGRDVTKSGRGGRKNGRRSREDGEAEIYDGRMTPSLSQRGNKRTKTAAHHHHHHGHHHHHHHHEPADAQPSPFNMLRFNSNTQQHPNAMQNAAHHHHHHHGAHAHPGHHHHHAQRSIPAPRMPSTIVDSKQLVDSVAQRPRKHLGFHLYETEVARPSAKSPTDPRAPYASTMRPLPRLDGKENSTLTVRIPRFYLAHSTDANAAPDEPPRFEEICKRRQVFGTEVYTDDSDVVAAAVHCGWIKGDFGEYNEDIHELCSNASENQEDRPDNNAEVAESPLTLPSKPSKPIIPPPNHDAHITILLLPALESYTSTSQHHMLSREWKGIQHDGMSYMIHRIDFVDEGTGNRNLERSASSRKKRIAAEEQKRQEAAKALLMLPGFAGMSKVIGATA